MAEIILKQDGKLVVQDVQVGGSNTGLPPTTGNDGFALIELSGIAAWRVIKESYVQANFAISTFSASASVVEVNQSIVTPAFTASYNRTPTTALLDDDEGSAQKDVTSTPTSFASNETFQKTANNDSVLFTLTADDGDTPVLSNTSISWRPRTFYGVDVDGLSTEGDIEGLANQQLDANRQITFIVTAGAGQHIYYAFPDSYGTPTFFVNGFEGGFILEADNVSVTNAFGNTQNYDLWKSTNANLGTTTVQVT